MKKLIFIFAILLTSCSSLQLQLATMNHASVQNYWHPRTITGFNYVLPSTPYTWNTFIYNRFNRPNSIFYSWNYPLNWYYPNNGYTFNYTNIVRPRRVVRRTPSRPQIQPRRRYTPRPKINRPVRSNIQRRPIKRRTQTRVSVNNGRRGNSNRKN